jgi:hypothetical protein
MVLACAAAAPAAAADKPVPCGGTVITDPAGDAKVGFIGLVESPVPGGANTDYTSLFLRTDGNKTTLNLQVVELTTAMPPDATAISYRLNYAFGEQTNYVQAVIASGGATTFTYGHSETSGLVKDGDTKGTLFEGKDGVISIDLPASHGGKAGSKLVGANAFSAYVRGAVNTQTDDTGDDVDMTVPTCSGAEAPAAESPAGAVPEAPQPQPGQPQAGQPQAEQPQAAKEFKLTAAPGAFKAKKVKKAKALSFTLSASEELTGVTAQFKKGSKVLGKGTLAKLGGSGKLAVKLAKKGLKKGKYALVVSGRRADGSTGSATITIAVK